MNVLNYEKSDYIKYSDYGPIENDRIMAIKKYVFNKTDELLKHDFFKLADEPLGYPFVTERFKKAVEDNNLEGFDFELVWDSYDTDVPDKL